MRHETYGMEDGAHTTDGCVGRNLLQKGGRRGVWIGSALDSQPMDSHMAEGGDRQVTGNQVHLELLYRRTMEIEFLIHLERI